MSHALTIALTPAQIVRESICCVALVFVTGFAATSCLAFDACFDTVGRNLGVDGDLLRAIAYVESSMNPSAMNMDHRERTSTYDVGLMQINSGHLPRLSLRGITENDLRRNPCVSIRVGAEILKDLIARHGATWNAVGAYNAACSQLKGKECTDARKKYVRKVHAALQRLQRKNGNASPPPTVQYQQAVVQYAGSPRVPLTPRAAASLNDWTDPDLINESFDEFFGETILN